MYIDAVHIVCEAAIVLWRTTKMIDNRNTALAGDTLKQRGGILELTGEQTEVFEVWR